MQRREVSPIMVPVDKPSNVNYEDPEEYTQMGNFGDGRLTKMEVDYCSQVDTALAEADKLAKAGKVSEAMESLYPLEKQTRLGCDSKSNSRILCHLVKLAFNAKEWQLLNECIVAMCKKRSLIKFAIKNMVKECCEMVDRIPDDETRNKLVETLRAVTAGKIYVEVERARLTKRVVERLEKAGKVEEARTMIMDIQVETFGSMELTEKVTYLLHQMRLCIAQKDYLRAAIISRKISTKFFESEKEEIQDLKLEYYGYMIEIGLNDKEYLDVCKHYQAVFETPKVKAEEAKMTEALRCMVVYVLLSAHTNEQWDLVHRINLLQELELVPDYKALLELFINQEIIAWKGAILATYEPLLRSGSPSISSIFSNDEKGNAMFKRLHECVGEHNVRMVAKYYTRISFKRMAQLLEFPEEEMEKFVCNLIVTGVIPDVKIHRPQSIINLRARRHNIETLDNWSSSVHQLTDILNKVSHLILKEEMVHKYMQGQQNGMGH